MITSIKLQNFQSHKNTVLQFDKNINIIVGKSDSGKSSIIRAINLVLNNRPSGLSFLKFGENTTKVILNINDNIIKRVKSKKENKYYINKKELKAFGQDVPEDVSEISLFDNINLQCQLDSPFLLSQSSGEISKYINKIVKFDIIDKCLYRVEKLKRTYKNQFDNLKEQQENYIKKIDDLSWIKQAEIDFNKLKIKYNKYCKLYNDFNDLLSVIENIKETDNNIIDIKNKLKTEKTIKILLNKLNKFNDLKQQWELLDKNTDDYYNLLESLDNLSKYETQVKNKYKKLMPSECPLCNQKIRK